MLEWCRVLDISDERGQLAGAMLAGLGADVVLVEPPGGSRSRRIGPFLEGVASDHERSLGHWAYNRGKTSVTLDLATSDADTLSRAARNAGAIPNSLTGSTSWKSHIRSPGPSPWTAVASRSPAPPAA